MINSVLSNLQNNLKRVLLFEQDKFKKLLILKYIIKVNYSP